jgi:hypothetical protein
MVRFPVAMYAGWMEIRDMGKGPGGAGDSETEENHYKSAGYVIGSHQS